MFKIQAEKQNVATCKNLEYSNEGTEGTKLANMYKIQMKVNTLQPFEIPMGPASITASQLIAVKQSINNL